MWFTDLNVKEMSHLHGQMRLQYLVQHGFGHG